MDALLERSKGRRGLKPLTHLLQTWTTPPDIRSQNEQRYLDICREYGLPTPATNVVVEDFTVDAYFPSHRLVVEIDAYGTHNTRTQFEEDRRRDAKLQLAGPRCFGSPISG